MKLSLAQKKNQSGELENRYKKPWNFTFPMAQTADIH